MVSMLLAS